MHWGAEVEDDSSHRHPHGSVGIVTGIMLALARVMGRQPRC